MTTISFALFDSVKDGTVSEGGMWSCFNAPECSLTPHQRIGSDSADFMGITGTAVAYLSLGVSGNQSASYVWKYQVCYGTTAPGHSMDWTLGSIIQTDRDITPCPTLTPLTKTGVTSFSNDNFMIKLGDSYGGRNFEIPRFFVGHMELQLILPTSSQASATTSSSGLTSSSDSTSSLSSLTSSQSSGSATRTGSLTSIPNPNVSWTESQAETTVLSPPVSNTSNTTLAASNSNINTGKIAGVATGIGAACILLLLIAFFFFRRRRRQKQDNEKEEHVYSWEIVPWTPRGAYPPAEWDRVRIDKAVVVDNPLVVSSSTDTPPFQFTKAPLPISESDHDESSRQSPTNSQTEETLTRIPFARAPVSEILPTIIPTSPRASTVVTALPPSYDMHPYHQIVTPRVMIEGSGSSSMGGVSHMDELGEWAERHRDVIPGDLERRLRAGGFVPGTNPQEIPRDVWERRFRVTAYELRGLQELYDI